MSEDDFEFSPETLSTTASELLSGITSLVDTITGLTCAVDALREVIIAGPQADDDTQYGMYSGKPFIRSVSPKELRRSAVAAGDISGLGSDIPAEALDKAILAFVASPPEGITDVYFSHLRRKFHRVLAGRDALEAALDKLVASGSLVVHTEMRTIYGKPTECRWYTLPADEGDSEDETASENEGDNEDG